MSLTHCPLCIALAVLSAIRGLGHALLVWQLLAAAQGSSPELQAGLPRIRLTMKLS
ncbi:MAG: hypothetical protein MUD04_02630 [Cyanobium sp. Prado107]|nr:hypothetical protein [Cyanobium sp. Prado107]